MPAAIAETAGALAAQGLVQTGVGAWGAAEAFSGAASGLSAANVLGNLKSAATILSPISSLMQVASGANASKRIGSNAITNGPAITPSVTMPTFGAADTLNAMSANVQEQVVRRGRAATILTSPTSGSDRLGSG